MASNSTKRRKTAKTARRRGKAIGGDPGAVKRTGSRRWKVKSQSNGGLWWTVVLGTFGLVCGCPAHDKGGKICKHAVAVNEALGKLWEKAKGMRKREKIELKIPQKKCHNCNSERFVKNGYRYLKIVKLQRYLCNECKHTFSGIPGFKGRHFKPETITRVLRESAAGLSCRGVAQVLAAEGMGVHASTVCRWIARYSGIMDKFAETLRPRTGHRWHCDEIWFKVLGAERWLYTVMDGGTRFILSWDVSVTKLAYRPLNLFLAARTVAGVDPWIFVTDGLKTFPKAVAEAFRGSGGFRTVHVRDVHLQDRFNNNNLHERLNGEFKQRIKTARGFNTGGDLEEDHILKEKSPGLIRLMISYHNFFRPHMGLDGITPAEAAGITIRGDDPWITFIQNAALHDS